VSGSRQPHEVGRFRRTGRAAQSRIVAEGPAYVCVGFLPIVGLQQHALRRQSDELPQGHDALDLVHLATGRPANHGLRAQGELAREPADGGVEGTRPRKGVVPPPERLGSGSSRGPRGRRGRGPVVWQQLVQLRGWLKGRPRCTQFLKIGASSQD